MQHKCTVTSDTTCLFTLEQNGLNLLRNLTNQNLAISKTAQQHTNRKLIGNLNFKVKLSIKAKCNCKAVGTDVVKT